MESLHATKCLDSIGAFLEYAGLNFDPNGFKLMFVMGDGVLRPRVSPHDGVAQWLASLSTPSDSSFSLVGDAYPLVGDNLVQGMRQTNL